MNKKLFGIILLVVLIPIIIGVGVVAFKDRAYAWISLCIAVVACIPFIVAFEKNSQSTSKLVILAVLIALSVGGRFLFSFLPHFKPVTAMVVITGIYLGYESGFICGAFTALISNFIFGQGPWTPFQMFAWGMIGLFAGLLGCFFTKHLIPLLIYGALSGVIFSLLMDVWTTLWWDGTFNLSRFFVNVASALPVTVIYAVSNVVFLFVLIKPLGKKLERIKTKYGV